MSKLQLRYNGSTISEIMLPLTVGDTFSLETAGKYCEDDISAEVVSTSRLPSAYQEVEYLTGGNGPRIMTPIFPMPNDEMTIELKNINGSINAGSLIRPFGSYPNGIAIDSYIGLRVWTGLQSEKYSSYNIADTSRHIFYLNSYGYSFLDNTLLGYTPIVGNNISVSVFGAHYEDGTVYSDAILSVYRFTWARDGEYIITLIPCYRKADNKPGMYDLVTNTFFTNQGTGEFIVGPDVN